MAVSLIKDNFSTQEKFLTDNRKSFYIHHKRGVKTIYFGGKAVAVSNDKKNKVKRKKLLDREIVNLIANVSKSVNNFIVKSNFEVEPEQQMHPSTWTNNDLYYQMPKGTEFIYIDISHCFWRIAYLKKYISKRMYQSVLEKPHLKTYRNMALACIVSDSWREYIIRGDKRFTIYEDRTIHRTVYDNIRFTCYNLMGDISDMIGRDNVIGYRTDGIIVIPSVKDDVIQLIKDHDFECTEKKITKMDDFYYLTNKGAKKHI